MESLEKENQELKERIVELEEKLSKYSNPKRNKKFYQEHRDEILERNKEYKKNLSAEKKKEYYQRWYQKKKESKTS